MQVIGLTGFVVALGLVLLLGVDRAKVEDTRVLLTLAVLAALFLYAIIRSIPRRHEFGEAETETHQISLPCTGDQVEAYIDILHGIFPNDAPPKETLRAVTRPDLNPFGLILIKDRRGAIVGGVEAYAMKEAFFKKYVDGELSDPDIKVGDIATLQETIKGRTLYVAVTIDDDLEGYKKGCILRHLLATVGFVLENVYFARPAINDMIVYGLGASDAGRNLMGRLNFEKVREGRKRWKLLWGFIPYRKEILPLYRTVIDAAALSDFMVKYPISLAELSLYVSNILVDPREEAAVLPKIEAVLARRSLAGVPA